MDDRPARTLSEEFQLLKGKVVEIATPILSKVLYLINRALERREQ